MDLNMTLEDFPQGLAHESLVWQIYTRDILLNSGNLGSSTEKDIVKLLNRQQITATPTMFKLYIWIDGLQPNPTSMMNQDFTFVLNASAEAGTAIPESDVLAYYVWIPRYKYKV